MATATRLVPTARFGGIRSNPVYAGTSSTPPPTPSNPASMPGRGADRRDRRQRGLACDLVADGVHVLVDLDAFGVRRAADRHRDLLAARGAWARTLLSPFHSSIAAVSSIR